MSEITEKPPEVKLALCVAADAGPHVERWDTFLRRRAEVDDPKNVDPSVRQILPYGVIWRPLVKIIGGVATEGIEVLTYLRGKAGTEGRLIDQRSCGFGGHVDSLPPQDYPLVVHLTNELERELDEELKVKFDYNLLFASVINCIRQYYYIQNELNDINAVHIALVIMINFNEHFVSEDEFRPALEEGRVEDLRWVDVERLDADEFAEYESWSQTVINNLRETLNSLRNAQAQALRFNEEHAKRKQAFEDCFEPASDNQVGKTVEEMGDAAWAARNAPVGDEEAVPTNADIDTFLAALEQCPSTDEKYKTVRGFLQTTFFAARALAIRMTRKKLIAEGADSADLPALPEQAPAQDSSAA